MNAGRQRRARQARAGSRGRPERHPSRSGASRTGPRLRNTSRGSCTKVRSRFGTGAHSVRPVAMPVMTSACRGLPRATGPLCVTKVARASSIASSALGSASSRRISTVRPPPGRDRVPAQPSRCRSRRHAPRPVPRSTSGRPGAITSPETEARDPRPTTPLSNTTGLGSPGNTNLRDDKQSGRWRSGRPGALCPDAVSVMRPSPELCRRGPAPRWQAGRIAA